MALKMNNELLYEKDPFSMPQTKFSVSMPKEWFRKVRSLHSPWMFLMNVTMNVDVHVDVRQCAPAAEGNFLDEDLNHALAQYEVSKVNVITCLPNGEERSVSFLNEEELVTAMARELGAP